MIKVAILQDHFDFHESVTHRVTIERPTSVDFLYPHHYEVVHETIHDHVMARFWAGGL